MENFIAYLKCVKQSLENIQQFDHIHIVLGNESCDIDSSVSALILAYVLHVSKTQCSVIPDNAIVIPIQNVLKEDFFYRLDNCYVYQEIGLDYSELLVYRDQLNLEELVCTKKVTTTLVDHHILSEKDKILEKTVVQIFDHRPRDPAFIWDENEVQLVMQEVGSCTTLIADHIFKKAEHILFKELGFLIYATVVFDTQDLSSATGRTKQLDSQIVEALNNRFKFTDDSKTLFNKLWKAHNDVSHLTPKQILMKDFKIIDKILVPGVPMLVKDFLKIDGSHSAIKAFAEGFKATVVVLVGIDTSDEVKRDITVFSKDDGLRDKLLDMFFNSQQSKGYDFELMEEETSYEDIKYFKQKNVKLSRKQIVAVIKDAVNK